MIELKNINVKFNKKAMNFMLFQMFLSESKEGIYLE